MFSESSLLTIRWAIISTNAEAAPLLLSPGELTQSGLNKSWNAFRETFSWKSSNSCNPLNFARNNFNHLLKEFLRMPVIPVPITRLFKAVLTARVCTSELSTSFLCPIGRNRHKSTVVLLRAHKRAPFFTGFKTLTKKTNQLTKESTFKQLKTARRLSNASPDDNSGETQEC